MKWLCKELIYKIKTPLHIGYGAKLGIIDRTQYYIPGKTMWGAATAKIGNNRNNVNWENLRKLTKDNLIFTNFYISNKSGSEVKRPEFAEDGLHYGNISEQQFEKKYITSFTSAGVEKDSGTAFEGDLHEIELIKNKCGPSESVFIKGYLFINEEGFNEKNYDIDNFINYIEKLQVGGERNYGYGKIKRTSIKENDERIFDWKINNMKKEKPILHNNGDPIFDTLEYCKDINSIIGKLRPIIKPEYNDNSQSIKINGAGLIPGSKIPNNEENIKINSYGILEFE